MQNQNPFNGQSNDQNQTPSSQNSGQEDAFVPSTNQFQAQDSSSQSQAPSSSQSINWDEIFAQLNETKPVAEQTASSNGVSSDKFEIDSTPAQVTDYVNSYQPTDQSLDLGQKPEDDVVQTSAQVDVGATDFSSSDAPVLKLGDSQDENSDESLEAQNIFELLGVNDGSDDEKEKFLDELQQVIWEDFLENDVELLVTSEEKQKVDAILAKTELTELEKQEELVVYLETLIPDLEEVMLEKALDLKKDLYAERIAGFKEYYAVNAQAITDVNRAEALMNQGKWKSSAEVMNAIK